jgi:hypothetical protein
MKINSSNKSNLIVRMQLDKIVKAKMIQMECIHDWQEYGHGYNCSKCQYYTGQNKDLNEIIRNEKE